MTECFADSVTPGRISWGSDYAPRWHEVPDLALTLIATDAGEAESVRRMAQREILGRAERQPRPGGDC